MRQGRRTTTTPGEAAVIMGICFGFPIVSSLDAVASGFPSHPFSNSGLIWVVGLEVVLAFAAVVVLWLRGFAVSTLMPAPTLKGSAQGIGIFFAAYVPAVPLLLALTDRLP